MYIPVREDFLMLQQSSKNIFSKIELLNSDFTFLNEIQGYVVTGSISINADSDIRRTCNLSMVLADESMLRSVTSSIWLTKYIRVYIGLKVNATGEVRYYNQGIFLFGENSYTYNINTNTLDLTCYDLMAKWNGLRDGQLTGSAVKILASMTEEEYDDYISTPTAPEPEEEKVEVKIEDEEQPNGGKGYIIDENGRWIAKIFKPKKGITYFGGGKSSRSYVSYAAPSEVTDESPSSPEEAKLSTLYGAMEWTTTQLGNISKYRIENIFDKDGNPMTIPHDLEYECGTTIYTIFKELAELYDGYEFFFDIDGTFVFQKIPTLEEDPCVLTKDHLECLVISEQQAGSFTTIRNATQVWGMLHEEDHYSETSVLADGVYSAKVTEIMLTDDGKIQSGEKFAVYITETNPAGASLKVNDLDPFPIMDTAAPIEAGKLEPNKAYVFRFDKGEFHFLGQFQIQAVCLLYNKYPWADDPATEELIRKSDRETWMCDNIEYMLEPDNPFAIDAIGEIITQVKSGSDYEKIDSDKKAIDRARYETWMAARYADSLTLELHIIPWLDVNQKIEYRVKHSNETIEWLIKSIDYDFTSGTMSITCARFYRLIL